MYPIVEGVDYALLSKSKYGIVRDYTVNFKEIDVPTEKERAEINGIKAQTLSTYLQSGIITEEEARDNLIKDPDSGFNDITDELPDEDMGFGEEETEGGSATPQDPFSIDEEPKRWITTKNDVRVPVDEGENNKKACEEFFEDKEKEQKQEKQNLSKYDKIDYSQLEEIPIAANEKEMVRKALNTDLTPEERKKKIIVRSIRNWRYTVINNGFDNYTIIDVEDLE